jgi:hypothetical protein
VPYVTTLAGARASGSAIENTKKGPVHVESLASYLKGVHKATT